jgi:hypothetical protein
VKRSQHRPVPAILAPLLTPKRWRYVTLSGGPSGGRGGVTLGPPRSDMEAIRGDTAMSPEPPLEPYEPRIHIQGRATRAFGDARSASTSSGSTATVAGATLSYAIAIDPSVWRPVSARPTSSRSAHDGGGVDSSTELVLRQVSHHGEKRFEPSRGPPMSRYGPGWAALRARVLHEEPFCVGIWPDTHAAHEFSRRRSTTSSR